MRSWAATLFLAICLFCGAVDAALLDRILDALRNAVDCGSCHALLVPLKLLAELGDSPFVGTVTQICITLKVQDEDVCRGIIAQEGPIIAHGLREINPFGATSTKLCDALLGLCEPPKVRQNTLSFPKPASETPVIPKSSGKEPFQIVHVSDVHVDREYTPGSEAACKKPICCRNYADHANQTIAEPAGPNGSYRCDTPVTMLDSFFGAVKEHASSAKFAVFTGDVVETSIWLVTQSENAQDMKAFNSDLASKLSIPVYGAIGNHESVPLNSFPRNTTQTSMTAQWVFDTQSADWAKWISNDAAQQLTHNSGSYSSLVPGTKLRIISLNTLYWYKANFWLFDSDSFQPDPNGILDFLIRSLQEAEDAGQRAWIIGHMPPGGPDALRDQSNYYDQIVQRYKNTIAAQFFGHSHNDEFEIAYSDYAHQTAATATNVAFIAPALTTRKGNPTMKTYDIDPDTYEVMDFRVYIANMSAPTFSEKIIWEKFYGARESYGTLSALPPTQALTPAVMHNLTTLFENDNAAFALYNERFYRGFNVTACTGDCKTRSICAMRAMRSENNCYKPKVGLNFKRDVAHDHDSESNCEGSKMRSIFQGMARQSGGPSVNVG